MKKRWWIPAVLLLTALGWWHFSTATPHGRLSARAALLIQIGALIGSDEDPDPAAFSDSVRQEIDKGTLMLAGPAPAFADIRDLALPGPSGAQPIRVYVPEGDSPKPVMVFFHGGGWTVGTLDHTDNLCRRLARSAGAVVVSVSYRLAPENPWPAALDDAWSALGQVQALCSQWGGDPGRMALCGESAGGNLALLLAQMAAANGMDAVRAVAVAYPITDAATRNRDSYRFFGTGYGLTRSILDLTRRAYLPDSALWRDPCVSPLYGTRSGLPPVLSLTPSPAKGWPLCRPLSRQADKPSEWKCPACCTASSPTTAFLSRRRSRSVRKWAGFWGENWRRAYRQGSGEGKKGGLTAEKG
jgi:acetyl esterase/lipase